MLAKSNIPVFFVFFILIHTWLNIAYTQAASKTTAKQVVAKFQDDLLAAMKLSSYSERYKKLNKPVLSSHDLAFIIRVGIGNQWKKLKPKQKQKLVDVFSQLAVAEYAKNFKDYNKQSFVFDSEEPTKRGGGMVVRMRFLVSENEQVKFSYAMKQRRGQWKILFITVKGVNQSLVRVKEYDSILKHQGFDVLIAKINAKIVAYSKL